MMTSHSTVKAGLLMLILLLVRVDTVCGQSAEPSSNSTAHAFTFRDAGEAAGIFPHAAGIRGHAAAWGDVDGSGFPSLFIGVFHYSKSRTSLFLRNKQGQFQLGDQTAISLSSCASGAIFVDLTNSGHLDLYVSNNARETEGTKGAPSALFRGDGTGRFTDVSKNSGACPPGILGRTAAALDYDGDGLLDLIVCDFYYSPKSRKGLALFHNKGDYHFEEVAGAVGLPQGASIAGAAVADLNDDGWPDLVLVSADGNNRIFLNDSHGKFSKAADAQNVLAWKNLPSNDFPTGVCITDLNRDGLPDIVIGHHFKAPWQKPVSIRFYLNRGIKNGSPDFEDITQAAGITPLGMKAPHVEIQDFDNDGWPDIFASVVKFKDDKPYPLIYKNAGLQNGIPRFREDVWGVNDFPNYQDTHTGRGSDNFFRQMLASKKILYTAAAPSADYDRDGKLDIFMATWWVDSRPVLLHNDTPGGNWLEIQVQGSGKVNRMGIGSVINIYRPGKTGDKASLLGSREIAIGYGWCSGQEAVAHFGLGKEEQVDVEVILPHGRGKVLKQGAKAGQRLVITP